MVNRFDSLVLVMTFQTCWQPTRHDCVVPAEGVASQRCATPHHESNFGNPRNAGAFATEMMMFLLVISGKSYHLVGYS